MPIYDEKGNTVPVKSSKWYSIIGKKGGLRTKQIKMRENPNYYAEIGLKGGDMMKKTRSKEWYSSIGKMSKKEK